MPDYEVVIEVVAKHIIRLNHNKREAAISDARAIAIRHTDANLLKLTVKKCKQLRGA